MGALHDAAKQGNLSEVKKLLDGGFLKSPIPVDHIDIKSDYYTAAYWAAFYKRTEVVKYLVEQRNANSADALAGAIASEDVGLIDYLITERKVDVNSTKTVGHYPDGLIMIAVRAGLLNTTKLLNNKYKASITSKVWGWVIPKGHKEMAKYLMEEHNSFPEPKTIDFYQSFLEGKINLGLVSAPPDRGSVQLILSYVNTFRQQEAAKDTQRCREAAEQGNVNAQVRIATEANQIKDYKIAHFWAQKAADQGNAEGQAMLGCLYRYGNGVNRDYLMANKWFQKAAAQGYQGAQEYVDEIAPEVKKIQQAAVEKALEDKKIREKEAKEAKILSEQEELNQNIKKFIEFQKNSNNNTQDSANNKTSNTAKLNDVIDNMGQISLSLEIPYEDLTLGKKLGQGGFGVVYQATWQHSDAAVKQLNIHGFSDAAMIEFKHEASIMAKLRNPHIIQLYGICTTIPYCLVMEFATKGSLYAVLHSDAQIDWPLRLKIAQGTAKGLAFLHNQKPMILHRDIKSMNVLLDEAMTPKLTDFGLAKIKDTAMSSSSTAGGGAAGTLHWMAPEILDEGAHTTACDVYSLGVLLWEIASRKLPYEGKRHPQILTFVLQGKREAIPADCPAKFGALITNCWAQTPETRLETSAVIENLEEQRQEMNVSNATTTTSGYMSFT